MKKIFYSILTTLFLVGCSTSNNTNEINFNYHSAESISDTDYSICSEDEAQSYNNSYVIFINKDLESRDDIININGNDYAVYISKFIADEYDSEEILLHYYGDNELNDLLSSKENRIYRLSIRSDYDFEDKSDLIPLLPKIINYDNDTKLTIYDYGSLAIPATVESSK